MIPHTAESIDVVTSLEKYTPYMFVSTYSGGGAGGFSAGGFGGGGAGAR